MRIRRILPLLPAAFLLIGCIRNIPQVSSGEDLPGESALSSEESVYLGDPVDRQKACLLLEESADHLEKPDYRLPTKRGFVTDMKTIYKRSEGSSTEELEVVSGGNFQYDGEAKTLYAETYASKALADGGGISRYYTWLFSENGKHYHAGSPSLTDFSEASYREMEEEEFDDLFSRLHKAYFPKAEGLAGSLRDIARIIQEWAGAAQGQGGPDFADSYLCKGEGDLTGSFTYEGQGISTEIDGQECKTWNIHSKSEQEFRVEDHLLVYQKIEDYQKKYDDSIVEERTDIKDGYFAWGVSSFTAPDLSKFPVLGGNE